MSHVAFIPARGGSKRLPNKNLAEINGMSLVEIAIRDAKASGLFEQIIVSTDSDKIAEVATRCGVPVHHRTGALASDTSPTIDSIRDCYSTVPPESFDTLTLLQPTSPLRTPQDIQGAMSCLTPEYQSVISVVDAPQMETIYLRGETGRLIPLRFGSEIVKPNGAIYIIRWSELRAGNDWWNGRAYAYRMGRMASVDIDTADDLEDARVYWKTVRGDVQMIHGFRAEGVRA